MGDESMKTADQPYDMPGRTCFLEVDGTVYRTYSVYARGLESTGGSYYFLDLTALGRQEDWEQPPAVPPTPAATSPTSRPRRARCYTSGRTVQSCRRLAMADDYWAYYRDTAQLWNIDRGDVDEIERWEDLSGSGVAERIQRLGEFGTQRRTIDQDRPADRTSRCWRRCRSAQRRPRPCCRGRATAGLVSGRSTCRRSCRCWCRDTASSPDVTVRATSPSSTASHPSSTGGWTGFATDWPRARSRPGRGVANAISDFDRLLGTEVSRDPLVGQNPPTELTETEVDAWRDEVIVVVRDVVRPAVPVSATC